MRHILARGVHIFLAFAVLISSTGFVVNRHYCGEQLKDTRLFFKPKSCCPPKKGVCLTHFNRDPHQKLSRKNCCHNTTSFHKLSQDQKTADAAGWTYKQASDFPAVLPKPILIKVVLVAFTNHFTYYKPPPLYTGIMHAWLQVFRF